MNYELSRHAHTALMEREISEEWLERALQTPARVEPDDHDPDLVHHLVTIPEHGGRFLRVVFNNRVAPCRIVTLYFDRSLKGKL